MLAKKARVDGGAMSQIWKWTTVAGVAGALLVYRSVRQRLQILHSAFTQHGEDMLNETLDESFPASDAPSHTPTVGPQVAH
jgi:hypothetical protein